MSQRRAIATALAEARDAGLLSQARLWIGAEDGANVEFAVGDADWFDLASLTKPLVGAALAGQALTRGLLQLDAPLAAVLPDYEDLDDPVRVVDLINHFSGLVAFREWFRELDHRHRDPEGLWRLVAAERPQWSPGTQERYSDTGYIVLARLLGRLLDSDDLAATFAQTVLARTDIDGLAYADGLSTDAVVAHTGLCPYRGRRLQGEVHDANAWHLGANAVHAGLFGTAAAVGAMGLAWLAAPQRGLAGIAGDVAARLLTPPREIPRSLRPLGWDRAGPGPSQAGRGIGNRAVGHLGFTGTSLWLDFDRGASVVLLTNRVAHDRDGAAFRTWRPRLHDLVWDALDAPGGIAALASGAAGPIPVA